MLGYLNGISFLGYDFQSYPNSQKISLNILSYPFISYHIPTYPKISSGANSQMPCLWNLVLLSTCVSIFLQLFSELGSLTCDSDCALKTRATPTLRHTPSDSVDLCRDRLVHRPPLLPPASPFKQNLFEERPILATPTPGFRGYVQPLHVQHPSSSPLGGNEKLSCSTKIGAVKLSDRSRGGLHTWLVRRLS